eukprot:SAG31_NODE_23044_length_512_cov_1.464891_1_plen_100_part_10
MTRPARSVTGSTFLVASNLRKMKISSTTNLLTMLVVVDIGVAIPHKNGALELERTSSDKTGFAGISIAENENDEPCYGMFGCHRGHCMDPGQCPPGFSRG